MGIDVATQYALDELADDRQALRRWFPHRLVALQHGLLDGAVLE